MPENHLLLRSGKKDSLAILIGLGIFLGVLSFYSPGSLFIFFLAVFIILIMHSFLSEEDRHFLIRLFILGLSLRVFLLLFSVFIFLLQDKWMSFPGDMSVISFFGDSGFCTVRSWWIAQYVLGIQLADKSIFLSAFSNYGHHSYLYLVALFYYIFGYSPLSIIFINCIISILTGIIYYFIAKEIAGIRSARITAFLIVFFPSLVLWSIVNLKDTLVIFLIGLSLFLFTKLLKANKVIYLILLVFTFFFQFYLRPIFILPTVLIMGLSYMSIKIKIKMVHIIFLIFVLIITLPFLKIGFNIFKHKVINYHLGVISTGGFMYHIYDDWLYAPNANVKLISDFGLFRGLLKGWIYYFLEPFPWNMPLKWSVLVAYLQIIIWYFLLIFSIPGISEQLKHNWRKSLVFVLYLLIVGSIISFTGGNIGTVFRIRDMLTPIILLFSSVGLLKILYLIQNDSFSG